MRALSPEQILNEARSINLVDEIEILEKDNLADLDNYDEIVISDDEVGDKLSKSYLSKYKVVTDSIFLRWSNMQALSKHVLDSDQQISSDKFDKSLISHAKNNANRSPDWWRQVGSLILKDGIVILEGWNKHLPTEYSSYIDGDPRSSFDAGVRIDLSLALHGEAGMIAEAARRGIALEGAAIYVTTFPCPNCARMIANAGIKKVYYEEGYSLLQAQEVLKNEGVEIIKVV